MFTSILKSIIYTGLSLDVITLSTLVCGFITFLYIYYSRLRKSYAASSDKLLENLLENYNPEALIADELNQDDKNYLLHSKVISGKIGTTIKIDGKGFINFASNNYLNLVGNNDIEKIAIETIRKYGVGSCGPRGFYGTVDVHLDLEERISKFMNMEETVVYSYGFSTVASAIPAYVKRNDVIFCDEQISFAAKKGMDASKCKVCYFKHNSVEDLETKIIEFNKKYSHLEHKARKFLVLEGIYGNTGTICNLPPMIDLRKKYKMRLFLDESLSIGVLGGTGRGITEHFNVDTDEVDMVIGSLEGLIGSIGGFCVGTHFIIEHQRLSGLGYCFSASLPPVLTRAAICAFDYLDEKSPEIFVKLIEKCTEVHHILTNIPFMKVIGDERSPVKYLKFVGQNGFLDDKHFYDQFVKKCYEKGLVVVLSPEPEHKSYQIRVNINVDFTEHDLAEAQSIMSNVSKEIMQ